MFFLDITATKTAELTSVSRQTINNIYKKITESIKQICDDEFPIKEEVEVDESYFCASRVKGKRGRGSYGKTIVFGIPKSNGKVYTEKVSDCKRATLQAVIRGRVEIESVIHSDKWRGYNGSSGLWYDYYFKFYSIGDLYKPWH